VHGTLHVCFSVPLPSTLLVHLHHPDSTHVSPICRCSALWCAFNVCAVLCAVPGRCVHCAFRVSISRNTFLLDLFHQLFSSSVPTRAPQLTFRFGSGFGSGFRWLVCARQQASTPARSWCRDVLDFNNPTKTLFVIVAHAQASSYVSTKKKEAGFAEAASAVESTLTDAPSCIFTGLDFDKSSRPDHSCQSPHHTITTLAPLPPSAPPVTVTMSAFRALRPVAARVATPRAIAPRSFTQRRLLNTDSAPVLYSAHAKAVGARVGHIDGDDLKVDLTMAKALGGTGDRGKTNPEELFAAGYGACFQSAMNAVAASMGTKMPSAREDSVVDTTVHLVGDMQKLDMGLRVDMKVKVKGLERDQLEKIVERAKEVCPYSRATKGNVSTTVEIVQFD